MSDVLIRDVSPADLELIRSAAADQGISLQGYLRATLKSQAAYLRRQEALAGAARRLAGRAAVSAADRAAVLDAMDSDVDPGAIDFGESR